MIEDFQKRGGVICACPPCVQSRGYQQADLIEGVTTVGASAMHAQIKQGAATLSRARFFSPMLDYVVPLSLGVVQGLPPAIPDNHGRATRSACASRSPWLIACAAAAIPNKVVRPDLPGVAHVWPLLSGWWSEVRRPVPANRLACSRKTTLLATGPPSHQRLKPSSAHTRARLTSRLARPSSDPEPAPLQHRAWQPAPDRARPAA
jgi:hypothetical protein